MVEQERKERKWLPSSYNGGYLLVAGRGMQFHKDTYTGGVRMGCSGVSNGLLLELDGGYTKVHFLTIC